MAKFSPDGLRVIAHDGANVSIWNLADGSASVINPLAGICDEIEGATEPQQAVRLDDEQRVSHCDMKITAMELTADQRCAVIGTEVLRSQEILIQNRYPFSMPDGPVRHGLRVCETSSGKVAFGFSDGMREFKISPDSKQLLTLDADRHARVWSIPDGALLGEWTPGALDMAITAYFMNDQAMVLIHELERERHFAYRLHSIISQSEVRISSPLSEAGKALVSPDGSRLLVWSTGPVNLYLYDTASGMGLTPGKQVNTDANRLRCKNVGFLGDRRIFARLDNAYTEIPVKFWVWNQEEDSSFEIYTTGEFIKSSELGDRIVNSESNSGGTTVQIWSGKDGALLCSIPGATKFNGRRALSPDGLRFLLQSDSNELQVWRRRRPENWWGAAALPEFWATVVIGIVFLWNLRRGWRKEWMSVRRLHA